MHRQLPQLYQQEKGQPAETGRQKRSHDLGRSFPAERLLRAFTFETDRPIKYGSSIGQSLQALLLLDPADDRILDAALADLAKGEAVPLAGSAGLWTKRHSVFAGYFLENWSRHKPTIEADERIAERERIWQTHRADTIDPPTKEDFDKFWDSQQGVRRLFLMDEVAALPGPPQDPTGQPARCQ